MCSEGRDHGDMLASWKELPQGADHQQAVQVATVMEHTPAGNRHLLNLVPLASRESYQALGAYV